MNNGKALNTKMLVFYVMLLVFCIFNISFRLEYFAKLMENQDQALVCTQYLPGMIHQVGKFLLDVVRGLLHRLDKVIYPLRDKRD